MISVEVLECGGMIACGEIQNDELSRHGSGLRAVAGLLQSGNQLRVDGPGIGIGKPVQELRIPAQRVDIVRGLLHGSSQRGPCPRDIPGFFKLPCPIHSIVRLDDTDKGYYHQYCGCFHRRALPYLVTQFTMSDRQLGDSTACEAQNSTNRM